MPKQHPNMAEKWAKMVPTWAPFGTMLGNFSAIFGCCFSIFTLNRFQNDFWSIFDPLGSPKTLKNQWFFNIFAFSSWSLLRLILERFWLHFGSQNRPQIDPKSVLKRLKTHVRFWTPSRTSKNQFFDQHDPNLAPKWPPNGLPKPNFLALFGSPRGTWNTPRPQQQRHSSFEPILDRFWIDFGSILGSFAWIFGWVFVARRLASRLVS